MPPCRFYKGRGSRCVHGDTCRFVHISPQKLNQKWYKKKHCNRFANGYCPRGENCTYIHRTNQPKYFPVEKRKPLQEKVQECDDNFEQHLQAYKRDFHSHMHKHSQHLIGLDDRSIEVTYQAEEYHETNTLQKSYCTTSQLLKPTILWQTRKQIARHGLKNANGKSLGKRERSSSVELDTKSRKIEACSTLGRDVKLDFKKPPLKKAKTQVVSTEAEEEKIESKFKNKDVDSLGILAKDQLLSFDMKKYRNPLDEDFHGFNELARMGNDLTKVALNTRIIIMENRYEEDCSQFAQQHYEVVDNEGKLHSTSFVVSNNNSNSAKNFNSEQKVLQHKTYNDPITPPVKIAQTQEVGQVPGSANFDEFPAISLVKCCDCNAEYPAFVVGLIPDCKGSQSWRCKDCAACAGCSKNNCSFRMSGGRMMMCSICGDHYHVTDQVHGSENTVNGSENTFFCKACGDFADSLLTTVDF